MMWLELVAGVLLTSAGIGLCLYIVWPYVRGFRREVAAMAALVALALASALYVHVAAVEHD